MTPTHVFALCAGYVAGGLVGLLGLLHLVWALGAPWPARDREQLAAYVMPQVMPGQGARARLRGDFPSRAMTLAAMCAFFAMSACLVAPEIVARLLPGARWLVLGIAAVFALRGGGGLLFWSRRRESTRRAAPSPFFRYNRRFYSPACLVIATLAAVSATTQP